MGKRSKYRDHIDPEYQRWGRKYPRFPGIAECVRLIRTGMAYGAWADIIAYELAENASECLPELVDAFRSDQGGEVRQYIMMALDIARLPESVPFLADVMRQGDRRLTPYAEAALRAINTSGARRALWDVKHA